MTDPIGVLWDPATVRLRCAAVTRAVAEGRSGWFTLDRGRLPVLAQELAAHVRARLSDSAVRPSGCWALLTAGGVDRRAELDDRLAGRPPLDAARARVDLAVVVALLGADPGPAWRYREYPGAIAAIALPVQRQRRDELLALLDQASGAAPATAPVAAAAEPAAEVAPAHAGPEGLAQAIWRAFTEGVFSADDADPLRVDASVLRRLDAAALRAVFQAGPSNPLVGLEHRAELLCRLGQVLADQAAAQGGPARPARLLEGLAGAGAAGETTAADLLRTVVGGWASIWPGGGRVLGLAAGDVWPHPWAGADAPAGRDPATGGWVPLHGAGQWLVGSLVEPLATAGVRVGGLEALTAQPDACRGGQLIDGGVVVARDPRDLARRRKPSDPLVVEWRALTVTLLDELAAQVRAELGLGIGQLSPADLPVPTRREGVPPAGIEGDGNFF